MNDLLALVRETLRLLKPEKDLLLRDSPTVLIGPEIFVVEDRHSLIGNPAPSADDYSLKEGALNPYPIAISRIIKKEELATIELPSSKKLSGPPLFPNAFKKILQTLSPHTQIFESPLCDKPALVKKTRWKKKITHQEALLVFKAPCHPLFYDLEKAINTKIMSAILISWEEFAVLKDSKARLVIFERALSTEVDSLKSHFFQCRFVEIPPPLLYDKQPLFEA